MYQSRNVDHMKTIHRIFLHTLARPVGNLSCSKVLHKRYHFTNVKFDDRVFYLDKAAMLFFRYETSPILLNGLRDGSSSKVC